MVLDNLPEAQARREALNPWQSQDRKAKLILPILLPHIMLEKQMLPNNVLYTYGVSTNYLDITPLLQFFC